MTIKLLGLTFILGTILFSCQKTNKKSFDLTTIPSDWVNLTETDSGLVIYNLCDGGNSLVTIYKNGDGFGILMHGQQEDYDFKILESYTLESDTVFIHAKWKESQNTENFKFIWTKRERGLGHWTLLDYIKSSSYVSSDKKSDFKVIDESCKDE